MRLIITSFLALFLTTSAVVAQNNIEFNASDNWIGYMNVFQLPSNGGTYEFGSEWVVGELKTIVNIAENSLSLQPNFNTYANGPADPYWVDQTTMEGNKKMEAITFVEPGSSFNGEDLTFSGSVMANTLGEDYTASFFIKALDPNDGYQDALAGSKIEVLPSSGLFTVSATAAELAPGLLVQYGFIVEGTNANPADEATLGSVRIGNVVTSIEGVKMEASKVTVSPNPTNDLLSIRSEALVQSYEIKNLTGQLLLKGTKTDIDVTTLSSGIYVVIVDLGDRKELVKFVKI